MAATTVTNGTADHSTPLHFDSIPDCIEAFRRGQFLIVLDAPARENEGDLIIAASALTPATAAFMIAHTSGYLCAPLSPSRAAALSLPPMVAPSANADPNRTAYTVTVDATAASVTTGISAADRAVTANALAAPDAAPAHFRRPGHVVPLVARAGGVRERRGHTEAGWELCRLAGYTPEVAVISELAQGVAGREEQMAEPGRPGYQAVGMMRAEECVAFGKRWGIRVCTIEDLVRHVEETEGPLAPAA